MNGADLPSDRAIQTCINRTDRKASIASCLLIRNVMYSVQTKQTILNEREWIHTYFAEVCSRTFIL